MPIQLRFLRSRDIAGRVNNKKSLGTVHANLPQTVVAREKRGWKYRILWNTRDRAKWLDLEIFEDATTTDGFLEGLARIRFESG